MSHIDIYIYTHTISTCVYIKWMQTANMSYIYENMDIYNLHFLQAGFLARADIGKSKQICKKRLAGCGMPLQQSYNNITYPTSGTGASFHAFLAWAMSWILLSCRKKYSANMPFLSTVKAGDRCTQKSQRRRGAGTREHHNKPCIFWCVCVPKINFFKL